MKLNTPPIHWDKLAPLAAAGNTSCQIAEVLGVHRGTVVQKAAKLGITVVADGIVCKSTKLNQDRIFREFVLALESLVPSCEMIDPPEIEPAVLSEYLPILHEAGRRINWLRRQLNKETGHARR